MRFYLLVILVALAVSCQKTPTAPTASDAKRFPFKGKIVSVDKAKKKANIDHDAIPGYMDAMAMDFPIHDDWVWDNLTPGAEIHAELVVDASAAPDGYWLEKVAIVAAPAPGQAAPPVNETFAQIGRPVPDLTFTDQDGKRFNFSNYRGKAVAVTFIYRECPLPDYCIKMSQNFSDLANQLHDDAEAKDKIRLLSISFDPARDTPAKLREYGLGYLGKGPNADFSIWRLAAGTDAETRRAAGFFGLRYEVDQNDKTLINHSLRTAVIGPDGIVRKIYAGNDWTTAELLAELRSTLSDAK